MQEICSCEINNPSAEDRWMRCSVCWTRLCNTHEGKTLPDGCWIDGIGHNCEGYANKAKKGVRNKNDCRIHNKEFYNKTLMTKFGNGVKAYTYEEVKITLEELEKGEELSVIAKASGRKYTAIKTLAYQWEHFKKQDYKNIGGAMRNHFMKYQRESTPPTIANEIADNTRTPSTPDIVISQSHDGITSESQQVNKSTNGALKPKAFIIDEIQSKRHSLMEIHNELDGLKLKVEGLVDDLIEENEELKKENAKLKNFRDSILKTVGGQTA